MSKQVNKRAGMLFWAVMISILLWGMALMLVPKGWIK